MLERRSLLRGLATLPLAAAPCGVGAAAADRIPALLADRRRAICLINEGRYASEDEADALMDRWGACDAAAIATPATTTAGAIASIEWAREELLEFGFAVDPTPGDQGVRIVLALLDGALGALRWNGGEA